jgi:hypothetical protein
MAHVQQRGDCMRSRSNVPGPGQQQTEGWLAVLFRRQEWQRWRFVSDDHDAQLIERVRGEVAQEPQYLRRLLQRPVHRSAKHQWSDGVQVVGEGCGNAEVAAAAQPQNSSGSLSAST